ncbi:MAG: hypothetical protein AMJ90_08440 [candidate division Zixibacteria bacterium SM23_73_2]|nr:MAG: hypothetical protein AMJ90_08440 [candidate division Zixibacteria bacterium SM23_73_2]
MLNKKQQVSVSKFMSLILRHKTKDFGLEFDSYGFVSVEDLKKVLKRRYPDITPSQIELVVKNCPKQRFEIKEDKIRARYGHSLNIELDQRPKRPPQYLFHGTSPSMVKKIKNEGLKPMRRQYVHLSKTIKQADEVGKRRSEKPAVFKIFAYEAFKKGIEFYDMGEVVLTEKIPPQFLEVLN